MPKSSVFRAGVYHYILSKVVGRCAAFEQIESSLSHPLEDGNLYLVSEDGRTALRLLPLVRVMPSPATAENACYFYNRQQPNGVRFVSYHFEQEAEIVNHFPDTTSTLSVLSNDVPQETGS